MEIIKAKQKLRNRASSIVSDYFDKRYQEDINGGSSVSFDKAIKYAEKQELCSLMLLAADKYCNTEFITDGGYGDQIAICAAKLAAGDMDAKDHMMNLIESACIEYYANSVCELLDNIYAEQKMEAGLTQSNYERGMDDAGLTETHFK